MTKVFVSFDWENDRRYKHLLCAWGANSRFDFIFNDGSSGEIKSNDIGRVKAGLTSKINLATYTLVIVGEYANALHKDYRDIGFKNWINYEIAQSKKSGNYLVAVKLDTSFPIPDELRGEKYSLAHSFKENAITTAINNAPYNAF